MKQLSSVDELLEGQTLEDRVKEALANIHQVLAAVERGQRVSSERGTESLTLFNWLFASENPVDTNIKTSIEREREAIIKLAEKRRGLIQEALEKCADGSREWGIFAIQMSELDHMTFMIRARSDS